MKNTKKERNKTHRRRRKNAAFQHAPFFKASLIMKKSVMVGHKKVDKWCGHAGNICFTEKLPNHLFNNMMRILLMNDTVLDKKKEL